MGFNVNRVNAANSKTGNLNTLVAGTVTGMNTQPMNGVTQNSLSATVTTLAETNTLTITASWQASVDGTTWLDVAPTPANGTNTIQSTGTGGADVAVTKVIFAPEAVYAFPYARVALTNGVATGAAADTYTVSYNWIKPSFT